MSNTATVLHFPTRADDVQPLIKRTSEEFTALMDEGGLKPSELANVVFAALGMAVCGRELNKCDKTAGMIERFAKRFR
jgi:hypothetical protein